MYLCILQRSQKNVSDQLSIIRINLNTELNFNTYYFLNFLFNIYLQ